MISMYQRSFSAPPRPAIDVDAYRLLGQLTSRAFTEGRLDTSGLAELTRHVLDLDLDRAHAVLSLSPTPVAHQTV